VVIVDEADQMTTAAEIGFLSILDSTDFPPNTIFIFTGNSTDGLEPRFLSRCRPIEFSSYGMNGEASALLERIWDAEAPADAEKPNFSRIVKDALNNIRAAVMALDTKLMEV
jgi:DNA polymerase III delta prime subunit